MKSILILLCLQGENLFCNELKTLVFIAYMDTIIIIRIITMLGINFKIVQIRKRLKSPHVYTELQQKIVLWSLRVCPFVDIVENL